MRPQRHPQTGNFDLVKQINLATVFRILDGSEPISRIQLAQLSQLAPASITKIIRQFSEIGLIQEIEAQASTGGRRAISLALNKSQFCSLAIRLGRSSITLGLYTLCAQLLAEETIQFTFRDQASLEQALIDAADKFLAQCEMDNITLIAIAATLPGIITDVVHYMPHIEVTRWDLATRLKEHFQIPAFIGHDIRSLALAEHYFGTTTNAKDAILIRIHHGVGAGIIIDGKMLLGTKGHLGEIGHIKIDPTGQLCHCGNFGCLETVVSNDALVLETKRLINTGRMTTLCAASLTLDQIIDAALSGDKLACEIIDRAGHYLGKVVAQLVNLFNPENIVLSGELMHAQARLIPIIEKLIETESLSNFHQSVDISTSSLNHQSAIGSFAIIKQALLDGELLMSLTAGTE